ncbi:MAG: hypothetical protein ACR2P3_05165 [Geminicoccaceae bacterium]
MSGQSEDGGGRDAPRLQTDDVVRKTTVERGTGAPSRRQLARHRSPMFDIEMRVRPAVSKKKKPASIVLAGWILR